MARPALALALLFVVGCSDDSDGRFTASRGGMVAMEVVAEGLDRPLFLTAPASDARLFVVEQPGRIRVVERGALLPTPFLDLTGRVSADGERGLRGLAFHPGYASNGYFYVDYTDLDGGTRVERYRVSADRNRADPASAKTILHVQPPLSRYGGGMLAFGPDGRLYVGVGDGGGEGHAQDPGSLLGKILRIDVDAGDPYAVPPDNPFAGRPDARGEIWAMGVRNPWRFAFDRGSGLFYLADVGQDQWEEVNVVASVAAGVNYGWDVVEGQECFRDKDWCDRKGLTLPVLQYSHSDGCSITGGYVYRGRRIPGLDGLYFYADYCRGWVRSFLHHGGAPVYQRKWEFGDLGNIVSFGEDASGELYLVSSDGRVFRMIVE